MLNIISDHRERLLSFLCQVCGYIPTCANQGLGFAEQILCPRPSNCIGLNDTTQFCCRLAIGAVWGHQPVCKTAKSVRNNTFARLKPGVVGSKE